MRTSYLGRNWIPLLAGAAACGLVALSLWAAVAVLDGDDTAEAAPPHRQRMEEWLREHAPPGVPGAPGRAPTAVLGVEVLADGEVLRVAAVRPGSAAEAAGILPGDELRRVAGERVHSAAEAQAALAAVDEPSYPVEVRRDGRTLRLEVETRGAGGWSAYPPADDRGPAADSLRELFERLRAALREALPDEGAGGPPRFGGGGFAVPPAAAPGALPEGALERLLGEALGSLLADPQGLESLASLGALIERLAGGDMAIAPFLRGEIPGFGPPRSGEESLPAVPALPLPGQSPRAAPPEAPPTPVVPPAPPSAPGEADAAYFGVIAALDRDSITLTGERGAITLALGPGTRVSGVGAPRVGGLAAAAVVDGVVTELLVVV